MRIPRLEIVYEGGLVHMYWRCHNRSHLLKPSLIKDLLLKVYFKHASKYGVGIVEFLIMDNHAHFILTVKDAESLGNFARSVHTIVAKFINRFFERDSQVFKDRYGSPKVSGVDYLINLIHYIWANRLKVNGKATPENDPYCSAYHRSRQTKYGKELVKYSELGLCEEIEEGSFFKDLLKNFYWNFASKIAQLTDAVYENSFFIGVSAELEKLKARVFAKMKMAKSAKG